MPRDTTSRDVARDDATAAATPGQARRCIERSGVDLSKPLLMQVAALGGEYEGWVHKSVSPRAAAQANRTLEAAAGSARGASSTAAAT